MKFYKRFPGDIQIKTGGLTLAEFGAYDRLLDHYYATEEPIATDEVYSITRALTRADRDAVDKVLRKFFDLGADGYTQERADEMIAEALPRIEAARDNGKHGGRPKGSKKKPTGLFSETQGGTETADSEKASQSQNQTTEEETSVGSALKPRPSRKCPPGFEVTDAMRQWAEAEVPGVNVERETAKFRDHTYAKALSDWLGAWRNWMRKALEFAPRTQPSGETAYQRTMRERMEQHSPQIAAKNPAAKAFVHPMDFLEAEVRNVLAITDR